MIINEVQNREVFYIPDAKNPQASTIGEMSYFKGKLWKLNVLLGYSWNDSHVTRNSIAFSTLAYNISVDVQKRIGYIIDWLIKIGVDYNVEISEAGFTSYIKISMKKKNLEIFDALYDEYIKEAKKHLSGRYKCGNFYYSEEYANKTNWVKQYALKIS